MAEHFWCEQLDTLFQWGSIKKQIPDSVVHNLSPRYELSPYQADVFAHFFLWN